MWPAGRASASNGLYRIHGNAVDHFGLADGLSSNSVNKLYEDQSKSDSIHLVNRSPETAGGGGCKWPLS
jgi:hypothetical protein